MAIAHAVRPASPQTPKVGCGNNNSNNNNRASSRSPPPAPGRASRRLPALLRAIQNHSEAEVSSALCELGLQGRSMRDSYQLDAFEPPLCLAAACGHNSKVFQLLLEHGADVNMTNQRGQTALSILCQAPHHSLAPDGLCFAFPALNNNNNPFGCLMAPKPDSTPVWDDESFAAMVSWPLVLSPFGLLAPQTNNNSNNSKSNKDEASVLRSASILLAAGAILELPLAALARANARPALARLLECYEASQAYFVLSRAGKNSNNNKNSNSNNNSNSKKQHLGGLSSSLIQMVCVFLAPVGSGSRLRQIAENQHHSLNSTISQLPAW
ncbi:unnamed protein product [Polarella glacialis]|uniref:ANK_REP_REGION domain-containing protein n=1 Tax=Polarella glacialis TaxID=89957 RepID=A0A813HYJ1_POLGL|nr:unnamed protein product [Polarella glacialis]CAE8648839.1 unnamed protein product [Polarella glacialis]